MQKNYLAKEVIKLTTVATKKIKTFCDIAQFAIAYKTRSLLTFQNLMDSNLSFGASITLVPSSRHPLFKLVNICNSENSNGR